VGWGGGGYNSSKKGGVQLVISYFNSDLILVTRDA